MYENENKESFFARLEPRLSPFDFVRVRGAYYLAKYGHRAQLRKETDAQGNPLRYFEHPRRVALRMMDEYGVYDADNICVGLLHDTLEDTDDIDAEIIQQFQGPTVAQRVRTLSKKPKEGYLLRVAGSDSWVRFAKLVDRKDNLEALPREDDAFRIKTLKDTCLLLGMLLLRDERYFFQKRPVDPDQKVFNDVIDFVFASKDFIPHECASLGALHRGDLAGLLTNEWQLREFLGV